MKNENGSKWYKNWIFLIGAILVPIIIFLVGLCYDWWWKEGDFEISILPTESSVFIGAGTEATISIKVKKYYHPVKLFVDGLTNDLNVSLIPLTGEAGTDFDSKMSINVSRMSKNKKYNLIITGQGADGKSDSCKYTLEVLCPPLAEDIYVKDYFYPSGHMGDTQSISLEVNSSNNPHSDNDCIEIIYSAENSYPKEWAGIYWQYPDDWGVKQDSRDLRGATSLKFWARGANGREKAEFKVGGMTGEYSCSIQPANSIGVVTLSNAWTEYTIDLTNKDLSKVKGGFCWVTNIVQNPNGCRIYLDDIRFTSE